MTTAIVNLGNVFEKGIVRPDPDRVRAILAWTFPATTNELRSFVGAAAMIAPHVPDYGYLKALLHPLLSGKSPYLPTPLQLNAFAELKRGIQEACLLNQPMPNEPVFL